MNLRTFKTNTLRGSRASKIVAFFLIFHCFNLFDDSILANSALDRLAHNAHQMIIEGESYRKK